MSAIEINVNQQFMVNIEINFSFTFSFFLREKPTEERKSVQAATDKTSSATFVRSVRAAK